MLCSLAADARGFIFAFADEEHAPRLGCREPGDYRINFCHQLSRSISRYHSLLAEPGASVGLKRLRQSRSWGTEPSRYPPCGDVTESCFVFPRFTPDRGKVVLGTFVFDRLADEHVAGRMGWKVARIADALELAGVLRRSGAAEQ